MTVLNSELISVVARHPDGVTSEAVATEVHELVMRVRSRLSKLHAYGLIGKRLQHPKTLSQTALWIPKVRP